MKISSLQENLKNGLLAVSHIAGKNINLPILNNVLIDAKEGNIRFVATDLEIGIVCSIRGKIEEPGSFTVEARVISDYIALLPNQKVDITKKDNKLNIKCENHKTAIKGLEADEYPLIPTVDRKEFYALKADEFRSALAQVIFATSTSETRLELTGVFFHLTKDKLILAATDSYRLAEKEVAVINNPSQERKVIIPAKTIQELIRVISAVKPEEITKTEREVKIYLSDNQVLFVVDSIELISRLIEGQYPEYRQIIPTTSETEVQISRGEILRAVKAAAIFSKSGINDINLDFPAGKNIVMVSSASSQTGENLSELAATVKGRDNGIVLNYKYLLDGLNNLEGENIRMEVINSNTPCILKPENDSGYLYIIMPIKQ